MLIFRAYQQYSVPCALALGGFDGLHKGHMTLVERAKQSGLPVGLTTIAGRKTGGDVFSFSEREKIFERAGVDFVYEIPFTEQIANTSAEDFLTALFSALDPKLIVCGEDFRFGRNAAGNAELLRKLVPCPVEILPIARENGEKIAISGVKKHLAEGDIPAANRLMQCEYFIRGTVEHGKGAGRTYGFPTANLSIPAEKFPVREGVYGGTVETETGTYPALINIGARPTFGEKERRVEAHLLGFGGDLYAKSVSVYPKEFFRPITRFADIPSLEAQISRDKARLENKVFKDKKA